MRRFVAVGALVCALVAVYSASADGPAPYWQRKGCDHGHRSSVAYKRIRDLVRHVDPSVDKQRVQHWATCLSTRAKAHHAHELARSHWRWRHEYAQIWVIRFAREPASWRSWADATAWCESGGTMEPTIHNPGGQYHGLMQFDLRTWGEAGGSGDPHYASRAEQQTRGIWLAKRVGTGRWPNCP